MRKFIFALSFLFMGVVYSFNSHTYCAGQATEYANLEEGLYGFENETEWWEAYHAWYAMCMDMNK